MCHTSAHKHRGSTCSLTPDCAKGLRLRKRTPIRSARLDRSKARAPSPQSTIASPPATRCALARSLAAAARCCACRCLCCCFRRPARRWRMTATKARRCHCAGAARARRQVLVLCQSRGCCHMWPARFRDTACTLAHARAIRARHTHCMGGRGPPANPLLRDNCSLTSSTPASLCSETRC